MLQKNIWKAHDESSWIIEFALVYGHETHRYSICHYRQLHHTYPKKQSIKHQFLIEFNSSSAAAAATTIMDTDATELSDEDFSAMYNNENK